MLYAMKIRGSLADKSCEAWYSVGIIAPDLIILITISTYM